MGSPQIFRLHLYYFEQFVKYIYFQQMLTIRNLNIYQVFHEFYFIYLRRKNEIKILKNIKVIILMKVKMCEELNKK